MMWFRQRLSMRYKGSEEEASFNSIVFNGSSSVIDMGSAAELDDLHDGVFTVDGWFNTEGTQLGALVSKGYALGGWVIYIEADGTLIFRILCATHNSERRTAAAYNDGAWHHFAAYFNDGAGADRKVSFAIDGVWEAIGDLAVDAIQTDAAQSLMCGRLSSGAAWWYDGKMGWYRISDNDRLGHGVNFASSIPPRTTTPEVDGNTVGLWPINEGSGTVANDLSANENDGTISNGVWGS